MELLSSSPYMYRLKQLFASVMLLLTTGLLSSCPAGPGCLTEAGEDGVRVTVGSIGWHTGLVLPLADVDDRLPESAALPKGQFLEIGWGDRRYYMAEDPSFLTLLRAGLLPTNSVLQVNTFDLDPETHFGRGRVVHLQLTRSAFTRLLSYLDRSFERSSNDTPAEPLGRGHYPQSLFYPANGRFWIFRTCNTWAAQALAEAGCKLSPPFPITADGLLHDVRRLGRK